IEAFSAHAAGVKTGLRVAVLIPCFNEEAAVGKVVGGFRAVLPHAAIYAYDNNSTDRTAEVAAAAGALVRRELHQGKATATRGMSAVGEAHIFFRAAGAAILDAASPPPLTARLLNDRLDMVVAPRAHHDDAAFRPGHRLGNRLFTGCVAALFEPTFT